MDQVTLSTLLCKSCLEIEVGTLPKKNLIMNSSNSKKVEQKN